MQDLFENQDLLPKKVRAIVKKFDTKFCKGSADGYQLCRDFLTALEPHGYTFEYGLDAVPYDLQKVGAKKLKQVLAEYYGERRADVGEEEVDNALKILSEHNDDLDGIGLLNLTLLMRLVDENDNEELYQALDELRPIDYDEMFIF
jgi:hypothetical protein